MKSNLQKLIPIAVFALFSVASNPTHAQDSARHQKESAYDQCGYDRRCRIDRLKRLNNATRRATILDEERQVANIAADFDEKELDESPRINKPFGLGISFTRLGAGYLLGYNFTGSLRLETSLIIHDEYVYEHAGGSDGIYIDGRQDAVFWNIAATYFFSKSWFSPYISAAALAGWGEFYGGGYYYDDWGGWGESTGSNSSRDTEIHTKYHIVSASAGFDVQLGIGLQARLGFEYGYMLYNQARYSAGNYDAEVRKGLKQWMNQSALWGPQFHIGWAF